MSLKLPPINVDLPFKALQNLALRKMYTDTLGSKIQFETNYIAFYFDMNILKDKLASADPVSFKEYEQKCICELSRLDAIDSKPSLIQRVRDYLELQRGVMPTMSGTSNVLNIPERTLRHQLQQMQTSYKQIREDIIKKKALKLIEYQQYSIETIAKMLGYSEPAAFNHAFK